MSQNFTFETANKFFVNENVKLKISDFCSIEKTQNCHEGLKSWTAMTSAVSIPPTFVKTDEVRKLFEVNPRIRLERTSTPPNPAGIQVKNGTEFKCNDFKENLLRTVNDLQHNSFLSDVSLGCDNGYVVSMHRLVLASSSTYLHKVFEEFRDWKHSIVVLNGVEPEMLNLLTQFMYTGRAEVPNDKIPEFLAVAKTLQIRGLESFYALSIDVNPQPDPEHGHFGEHMENSNGRMSCMYSPVSESGRSSRNDYSKYQFTSWERESKLNLLATLADIRSSSEADERSTPRLTPQTPSLAEDDSSDSNDTGGRGSSSRGSKVGPSASAPHYRSDNNENVPFLGEAVHQESRLGPKVVQHSARMGSEPLSLINSNLQPSVSGTGKRIYDSPMVHRPEKSSSSRRSSISSSPIDFSNWKKELEARRKRLWTPSPAPGQPPRLHIVEEDVSVESNRRALLAVAKALSTPKTIGKTPAKAAKTPARRSTPKGSNWRSRQPTECNQCGKVFSNKFNLKQHIHNMHSLGGEVNCKDCGKVVKNKWYLRRHMVTQHGAPLKKKKIKRASTSGGQNGSSSEDEEDIL